MLHLHKYVPVKKTTSTVIVDDVEHAMDKEKLYPIGLGGDQLSVARYRGSKVIRRNSTTPTKQLEGLFSIAEDWHTEVILLKVLYKVLMWPMVHN